MAKLGRINNGSDGSDFETEDIASGPGGDENSNVGGHFSQFLEQPSEATGSMDRTGEAVTVFHGFLKAEP